MDLNQIISCLLAIIALLTGIIDLLLKAKDKRLGPIGNFDKKISIILFIVAATAAGWFAGYYSREFSIIQLNKEKSDLQKENASLVLNLQNNVRIRDKALGFFQDQLQMSSEEFDRISGREKPKQSEAITVYEHNHYQGARLFFPLGNYPDLHLYWFGDKISSIKVPGGVQAIAYEDTNYGRRTLIIRDDTYSLESLNANWNDKISSIKVIKK